METHTRPALRGQRVPPREDPRGQRRTARRRLPEQSGLTFTHTSGNGDPGKCDDDDGETRQPDVQHDPEAAESPQEVRHLILVRVARLDLAALRALAAASLGQPMFAVHVSPDEQEAERFRRQWATWGDHLRLEVIDSPYRAIIPPLAHYVEALHTLRPDLTLTAILPEIVVRHWWHQLLHTRTGHRLRRALRSLPGIVITSIPIHIRT